MRCLQVARFLLGLIQCDSLLWNTKVALLHNENAFFSHRSLSSLYASVPQRSIYLFKYVKLSFEWPAIEESLQCAATKWLYYKVCMCHPACLCGLEVTMWKVGCIDCLLPIKKDGQAHKGTVCGRGKNRIFVLTVKFFSLIHWRTQLNSWISDGKAVLSPFCQRFKISIFLYSGFLYSP